MAALLGFAFATPAPADLLPRRSGLPPPEVEDTAIQN